MYGPYNVDDDRNLELLARLIENRRGTVPPRNSRLRGSSQQGLIFTLDSRGTLLGSSWDQ